MSKIRIGIMGYGNLGRGVELACKKNPDMELVGIFTRRNPSDIKPQTCGLGVYSAKDAPDFRDKIDVMILCGGSATDLINQGPEFAQYFNTVDSFDTHAKIPEYFDKMDKVCKSANTTSIISVGWDPGMFSLLRVYSESVLPDGNTTTFWGPGVSQGHSDAIRRIDGVLNAKQYTIPIVAAIDAVRNGKGEGLTTRQKHLRDCYVVLRDGADKDKIEHEIKTMPNYFSDYDTTVHFISIEEFNKDHTGMAHGGFVVRSGNTSDSAHHTVEYSLKLDSNPEFTGSVLLTYARAAYRLKNSGAYSVLDVPPSMLSVKSPEELRKTLL